MEVAEDDPPSNNYSNTASFMPSRERRLSRRLSIAGSKRRASLGRLGSMLPRGSLSGPPTGLHRSMSQMGSKVAHYASLVVAENPVEVHKEYLEQLEEEDEEDELLQTVRVDPAVGLSGAGPFTREEEELEEELRLQIVGRWQKAINSIISSAKMVENVQILNDQYAEGAERFIAVVELEQLLHDNPHKKLLVRALELKHTTSFDSVVDLFLNEMLLTGERIFDFFTPGAMGHHIVFFTFAMMFVCFIVFFYMVGSYPLYVLQTDSSVSTCLSALNTPSGRQLFVDWMFPGSAVWCFKGDKWTLGTEYLRLWGARYAPFIAAEPSRWFTSWFVHHSFEHVTSNMALFLVVAYQIEEKYGTWRITLLYFMSALGGNFFSAAFENGCSTVQGASGGVFGMIGLFIADLVLNFETVKRPLLRGLLMLAFLVYFIVSATTSSGGSSAWSHVGGFLCGLFPSFLFLPNLKSEKWEQVLPIAGGFVVLGVYTALPLYFYKHRLPMLELECAA